VFAEEHHEARREGSDLSTQLGHYTLAFVTVPADVA
jgi:hypothetical protein